MDSKEVFTQQMGMKRNLLQDPKTMCRFYTTQAGTREVVLEAERELLMVLINVIEAKSDVYNVKRVDGKPTAVFERITGTHFIIADYAHCPLKLCGLLVQEDFIILSPEGGRNTLIRLRNM